MAEKSKKIDISSRLRLLQKTSKKIEEENKTSLLSMLSKNATELKPYASIREKEFSIPDELARRENIKNIALEQDIALKRGTLSILFLLLGIETAVIFAFALLQGTHWFDFRLEEWSFKLLIGATILQITYMLQVAVKHLFPNK